MNKNIVGVIAEYNPFHNGHKYHTEQMREKVGTSDVIAIMSGNYVQRGGVAIFDKHIRAQAAVQGGIDLVLELPPRFALQSAEKFAACSVGILEALNCVKYLAFGVEDDDLSALKKLAMVDAELLFQSRLKECLKQGISFPSARHAVISDIYGNMLAEINAKPNNILAIEYLKALLNSNIQPVPIKRMYVDHDSDKTCNPDLNALLSNHMYKKHAVAFASASELRKLILSGSITDPYIPPECADIYKYAAIYCIDRLDTAVIAGIRKSTSDDLKNVSDVCEGLHNRIKRLSFECSTIDELVARIKTKRYTRSRIRRIILNTFLGINANNDDINIPYIRILNFSENGRALINTLRETASVPIVKNYNDIRKLNNPLAEKAWKENMLHDSLFELSRT